MYNSGKTLKTVAKIVEYAGFAASVLTAVALMVINEGQLWWLGIIVGLAGIFSSWIGFLVLYTIGDTNTKCYDMAAKMKELEREMLSHRKHEKAVEFTEKTAFMGTEATKSDNVQTESKDIWICQKCGHKNQSDLKFCAYCGEDR